MCDLNKCCVAFNTISHVMTLLAFHFTFGQYWKVKNITLRAEKISFSFQYYFEGCFWLNTRVDCLETITNKCVLPNFNSHIPNKRRTHSRSGIIRNLNVAIRIKLRFPIIQREWKGGGNLFFLSSTNFITHTSSTFYRPPLSSSCRLGE